jgi:Zn finger protein HypA/HybF involved in hydrogenase expression
VDSKELECVCGQKVEASPDTSEPWKCPACGREMKRVTKGSMGLSDREIEATHEVMAEDGIIWSGAR